MENSNTDQLQDQILSSQTVPIEPPQTILGFSHQRISRKKMSIYLLLSLILLGGMIASLLTFQSSSDLRSKATNNGPTLALNSSTQSKTVGSTIPVGITIHTNMDTISAAALKLSYDPTAIQIVSFTAGTPLPIVLIPESHSNGLMSVTLGVQPASPFKGAGVIGTIQVKILSAKQSSLEFTSATQVAAIGKTTNALVSATGSTITGVSAGTLTLTPTRIPGSTNTPTPTRHNSPTPTRISGSTSTPTATSKHEATTPAASSGTLMQGIAAPIITDIETVAPSAPTSEDYSPFANTSQHEAPKRTAFDQLFSSILEFFRKLF